MQFIDRAQITVKAGDGGHGKSAFRHEKFMPKGGPSGGDGGRGGDVIFRADRNLNTLLSFRYRRKFVAKNGENGEYKNQFGKNAAPLYVDVPPGTIVTDEATGEVLADLAEVGMEAVIARGGRGGRGNAKFANSANRAPSFAEFGEPGEGRKLRLELKLLADVGLVGYPSVGKSSLVASCSAARPEIADYHFTTITPVLGVVQTDYEKSFVMADIPGLIEGASEGVGLGYQFLRHIHRSRVLIHIVDGAGSEGRDPLSDLKSIHAECAQYDPAILKKPIIVAANKIELIQSEEQEAALHALEDYCKDQGYPFFKISAALNQGIYPLLEEAYRLLESIDKDEMQYESEVDLSTLGSVEKLPLSYEHPEEGLFIVEGPKMEKMLGYTNLESEKGFLFFQRFMVEQGIIKELKKMGLKEGDTIQIYSHAFEYYDDDKEEE